MGNHDAVLPVVVRLANHEVKFRIVCGSVPGDYDLLRVDSLAGSEVVATVRKELGSVIPCYWMKPRGRWRFVPQSAQDSLAAVLQKAVSQEVTDHA